MRRREVGTRQCDRVRWATPTVMPQPKDGRTDLLGYRRPTERMVSKTRFTRFYILSNVQLSFARARAKRLGKIMR